MDQRGAAARILVAGQKRKGRLMASIKKTKNAKGDTRYRVRFRVNGRTKEQWFATFESAKAHKTKVEGGAAVDPRAGKRTLDDYFTSWLSDRLVKGRPLTPSTRDGYRRLFDRN